MTPDDLIDERFGRSPWWTTRPTPEPPADHDLTIARRRRQLAEEMGRYDRTAPREKGA